MMEDNKKSRPKVRFVLTGWGRLAAFWRVFGQNFGRSAIFVFKMLKWPVLVAIPIFVLILSAWWSLTSSLSSDIKTVPDVTNLRPEQAKEQLSFRSLKLAVDDQRDYSDWHDEGTVMRQQPEAGAKIKRGRTVLVTLSAGPRKLLVPNLLRKSVREAKLVVQQKGFKLRVEQTVYSDNVPEGHVIAQSPQPSTAFVTEFVNVLESKGPPPQVVMLPKLEGRPLQPVIEFLRGHGIRVVVLERGSDEEISEHELEFWKYLIYRQSPRAGTFLRLPSSEAVILRVERRRR